MEWAFKSAAGHVEARAGLRALSRSCVIERDRDTKVRASVELHEAWRRGGLPLEEGGLASFLEEAGGPLSPGLPDGLVLTDPRRVPRRGFGTRAGLVAHIHAIAHIEWNAINLAWDAVWRFDAMPREYYDDWAGVAAEEAAHFAMLRARLVELGSDYGLLPAHAGLWEAAEATTHDVLDRMALVPRVLEARGLDVTPAMIARLREFGDEATASILDRILEDEVGHVRIGSRWFHHLCRERGLEPAAAFEDALRRLLRGRPRAVTDPRSLGLRADAGFRDDEMAVLAKLASEPR